MSDQATVQSTRHGTVIYGCRSAERVTKSRACVFHIGPLIETRRETEHLTFAHLLLLYVIAHLSSFVIVLLPALDAAFRKHYRSFSHHEFDGFQCNPASHLIGIP